MSLYATLTDFATYGLPSAAAESISTDAITKALTAASSVVDGYIANHYVLPIAAPYPAVLVQNVCKLAQWELLAVRGFNPESTLDQAIRMRYDDAMAWCKDVSARRTQIAALKDSDTDGPGEPVVMQSQSSGGTGFVVNTPARLRGF